MPARIHQLDLNEDSAYLREALRLLVQAYIEIEVSARIEASPYERSDSRRTQRNGYRRRSWRSSLGEITLFIPKLRKGTYYPAFLDSLSQAESTFIEVAEDAYRRDTKRHDLERLAEHLQLSPVHRSQLSEIEERLHDLVQRYRFHQNDVAQSILAPTSAIFTDDEWHWLGKGQPQARLWGEEILALAA